MPLAPRTMLGSRGRVFVFNIGSLTVRLHASLLIALPFFAWFAEVRMRGPVLTAALQGVRPLASSWAWAGALTALLSTALLIHQAAHALAARMLGMRVTEIPIGFLGGCAHEAAPAGLEGGDTDSQEGERSVARSPTSGARAAAVAAAGPALSVLGGLLCTGAGRYLTISHGDLRQAILFAGEVQLVLGALELLPTPPLDGGRVLLTLLERRVGRARAVLHGARLGKFCALLCALAGTVGTDLLLLAVAAILWAGADQAEAGAIRSSALSGLTVRGLLGPTPWTACWIDGEATAEELSARMREAQASCFAVSLQGRLAGVVSARDVARLSPAARAATRVHELSHATSSVRLDGPALEASAQLRALGLPAMPVIGDDGEGGGELVALLTREALDVAEALGSLAPVQPPARPAPALSTTAPSAALEPPVAAAPSAEPAPEIAPDAPLAVARPDGSDV